MSCVHIEPVLLAERSRALSAAALSPIASMTLARCTSVDQGRGRVDSACLTICIAVVDQVGRTRGSSQVDRDLEQARGFLNEQPNVWIWQPSVSLMPSATSAQKYRAGRDKLIAYNKRLAAGQAVFERRSDNLQALVDRIANDIGSDSAIADRHIIEQAGNLFDLQCDDIFYFNKGRLYADYLLLRELGSDFQNVIRDRDLTNPWNQMVDTFRVAAELDPWIVWNGYPDGLLIPNHLAAQGFYLLRARTQLREISSILQK